jgi:SAM-dependent methyltransferase
MTAHVPPPLTGERTVPGVPHENYWFRRHEAVYAAVPDLVRAEAHPAVVLDAGSGEGYGTGLLTTSFPDAVVAGIDYDTASCAHARATHASPRTAHVRGLVTALPLVADAADVVVSLQVVEHIWNPDGYVRELVRVCRPGGVVVLSTPNRLTFSPGLGRKERPDNVFHCREFDADELVGSATRWAPQLAVVQVLGLRHGPRLRAWEAEHGELVAAQLAAPPAQWPAGLLAMVASVDTGDFALTADAVDDSLDLVVVLRKAE